MDARRGRCLSLHPRSTARVARPQEAAIGLARARGVRRVLRRIQHPCQDELALESMLSCSIGRDVRYSPGHRMNADLVEAFRAQGAVCARLGAPLYAELIARAAQDLGAGGRVAALVGDWAGDVRADAVALRLLGAVHARVLAGAEPELAAHYPSVGGVPRWPAAWRAFLAVLDRTQVNPSSAATTPVVNRGPRRSERRPTRACGSAASNVPAV